MRNGILQPMGRGLAAMRGLLIVAALAVAGPSAARGVYWTYQQWADASESERVAYITGAVDSIMILVHGHEDRRVVAFTTRVASHYSQCLVRSTLTNTQLAENVLRFAENRHDLHAMPVQAALLQYLISVCGAPPKG